MTPPRLVCCHRSKTAERDSKATAPLLFNLLPGATALGLMAMVLTTGGTYASDDAFILLTYARNLVEGQGFVFNVGERVWGYTSPLQVLVLATLQSAFPSSAEIAAPGTALGLGQLALACGLAMSLVPTRQGRGSHRSALAMAIFLVPPLHLYAVLEGTLLVVLQAAAAFCALRQRGHLCALLLSLSCLARPDSVIFSAVILLALSFTPATQAQSGARGRCAPWLTFALPGVLWLLFAQHYHGSLLPNTLGAKTGLVPFTSYWTRAAIWISQVQAPAGQGVTPWLLILLQLSLCARKLPLVCSWVLLVYPWVLITAYAAIGPPVAHSWEIYSAHFWFLAGAGTGLLLLIADLVRSIDLLTRADPRRLLSPLTITAQAALIIVVLPSTLALYDRMQSGFWVGARYESYRQIARWFDGNAHGTPSLAHYEVGTLGYFTQRTRIVDLAGLVTARPDNDLHQGEQLIVETLKKERPSHMLRRTGAPKRFSIADMTFRRVHDFPARGYTKFTLYRRIDYRPNRRPKRKSSEVRTSSANGSGDRLEFAL